MSSYRQLHQELGVTLSVQGACVRCAGCNTTLVPVPHEMAAARVPPFVAEQQAAFVGGPACGGLYWPGTHWSRICAQLGGLAGA